MSDRMSSKREDPVSVPSAKPSSIVWVGPSTVLERVAEDTLNAAFPLLGPARRISLSRLVELEYDLTARRDIDAVISPLFWRGGDGIETARLLERMGFRNSYRIVTPVLPRPDIVLREIRVACPAIDIDLIPLAGFSVKD